MRTVRLTHGKFAIVDDVDYKTVSLYSWHLSSLSDAHRTFYALRTQLKEEAFPSKSRRSISMHSMVIVCPAGSVIDHKNGDGLDNRRENLRVATQLQNMGNQRRHIDSTSPYKGIWWMPECKKWAAQVFHNKKHHYLGLFVDPKDAAIAYDAKAVEIFGPFARLNFPQKAA